MKKNDFFSRVAESVGVSVDEVKRGFDAFFEDIVNELSNESKSSWA